MTDRDEGSTGRQGRGPLEAGALTIGGVDYPFTPLPGERVGPLLTEWYSTEGGERLAVAAEILRQALGAQASAEMHDRAVATGGAVEWLACAVGQTLGASSRAAAQAREAAG